MKDYGYFKGKQSNKHLVNYYMDRMPVTTLRTITLCQ